MLRQYARPARSNKWLITIKDRDTDEVLFKDEVIGSERKAQNRLSDVKKKNGYNYTDNKIALNKL